MPTAAAIPVLLYQGEDATTPSEFKEIAPLSLKDIEQCNLNARAQVLAAASQAAKNEPDEYMRRALLDSAMRVSADISLLNSAEESAKHFKGLEGLARVLHYALARRYQRMTYEHAVEIMKDDRNQFELVFIFQFILGRLKSRDEWEKEQSKLKEKEKGEANSPNPLADLMALSSQ